MKYRIQSTTDGRCRGSTFEGDTVKEVVNQVNSLFKREFNVVSDKENELIVHDDHQMVVLKKL